jgi:thioredoxin 1
MSGKIVTVSDAEFESSVLQGDKPLAPTVEEIAGEYEGKVLVGKLNVDDNPATATKYGIRGIPTLLLFKGGQVVQQLVGVKSKAEIKKVIDENI